MNPDGIPSEQELQETGLDQRAVARAVRLCQLLDLYGMLLTERQRQFVKLHFEDDLSFGEIAKEFGVSRQAIHDAVKHAEQSLEDYDRKLGLSLKGGRRRSLATATADATGMPGTQHSAPASAVAGDALDPVVALLAEIHDRLRRSGGVIYNAEGITRDLGAALDRLRALQQGNG